MHRLAALLALVLGCSSPPADGPQPPAQPEAHASSAARASPAPSASPADPTPSQLTTPATAPTEPTAATLLDEQAVRALVERWLAAQNDGDFEAYSATYASPFFGIKRSGPRTTRHDRAAWLTDRRHMFRKPMRVQAAELQVAPSSTAARVSFTQTWSSGNYQDVGPKQLVVARQDGGLFIAREEMLESTVLSEGTDQPAPPSPGEFTFVEEIGGRAYLVLEPAQPLETQDVQAQLLERGSFSAATKPLGAPLPTPLAALAGETFELRQADGEPCRSTAGDPLVLVRFVPHFGMVEEWSGQYGPKTPDARVAEEIWSMGADQPLLAFPLSHPSCRGSWARLAELPAPTLLPRLDAPSEFIVAARATREWKRTQAEFAESEGTGSWEASEDGNTTAVGWAASPDPLFVVQAHAGWGCGGFEGGHWSAWSQGEKALERLSGEDALWNPVPEAAIDLGSGPLLLSGAALFRPDGTRITELVTRSYDCGC